MGTALLIVGGVIAVLIAAGLLIAWIVWDCNRREWKRHEQALSDLETLRK